MPRKQLNPAYPFFSGVAISAIASAMFLCNSHPDAAQREPIEQEAPVVYTSPWERCGSDTECERMGPITDEERERLRRQMFEATREQMQ
jgi:hypothetical protein